MVRKRNGERKRTLWSRTLVPPSAREFGSRLPLIEPVDASAGENISSESDMQPSLPTMVCQGKPMCLIVREEDDIFTASNCVSPPQNAFRAMPLVLCYRNNRNCV